MGGVARGRLLSTKPQVSYLFGIVSPRTAMKIPKRKEKLYLEEKKILFCRKENFTSIFRLIRYLIP